MLIMLSQAVAISFKLVWLNVASVEEAPSIAAPSGRLHQPA